MLRLILEGGVIALLAFLYYFIGIADLPPKWGFVDNTARFILILFGLDLFTSVLIYFYRKRKKLGSRAKDNITVGLSNIYYFLATIGFILLALSFINIDVKTLFTTLSIVAAAIAIISKEFLSAILGGFVITFSKELSIGDEVKIGEHKGKIVDMNLTKIALITEDDDLIYLPNDKAYNNDIINLTKLINKRVNIRFELPLHAVNSVEELEQELIETLQDHQNNIKEDSFVLKITKIEKEGISFTFQYILKLGDGETEKEIRKKTIRKVINRVTNKVENIPPGTFTMTRPS